MSSNFINNYKDQTVRLHEELLRNRTAFLLELIGKADSPVSIVLLNDSAMAEYNQRYRFKKGPTNVLSFPAANYQPNFQTGIPAGPFS
ncbi:MAG: hypothetical protein D3924_16680, partial [Candidatus Electrothrix sp. AR4]|nr:hypothetical protein [Candidatus Electrothrix sp. AR4]